MSTRRLLLDAPWYLNSRISAKAGHMPHFIITAADADKAAVGVLFAGQPVPMQNMKRVASVHQVFVCQMYEDNNYLGIT